MSDVENSAGTLSSVIKAPCDFWTKANITLFMYFIKDEDYYFALWFYSEIFKLSPLHIVSQCAA